MNVFNISGVQKYIRIKEGDVLRVEVGTILINNIEMEQGIVDDGEVELRSAGSYEVTFVHSSANMVVLDGELDLEFNDERNWGKVSIEKRGVDGWVKFDKWVDAQMINMSV